jgi:hypothetical protein
MALSCNYAISSDTKQDWRLTPVIMSLIQNFSQQSVR